MYICIYLSKDNVEEKQSQCRHIVSSPSPPRRELSLHCNIHPATKDHQSGNGVKNCVEKQENKINCSEGFTFIQVPELGKVNEVNQDL